MDKRTIIKIALFVILPPIATGIYVKKHLHRILIALALAIFIGVIDVLSGDSGGMFLVNFVQMLIITYVTAGIKAFSCKTSSPQNKL